MSRSLLKRVASVAVMLASLAFLVWYWRSHPEITAQLQAVSPVAVAAIIILYLATILVLVGVYDTILRICGKPIGLGEHTLLTMYSSIINFFGPLQSGPGFRTLYLKKKHGVSMKSYMGNTLVYYALFGIINLLFLAVALLSFAWLPALLLLAAAGYVMVRLLADKIRFLERFREGLRSPLLGRLALLTLLQALLVVAINLIELQAIGLQPTLLQAIGYAGAGSLAVFVSLTPGALGFRESFQYFAQDIHHIDSSAIVTANVLDRAAYVVVLGILFVLIIVFHARSRLKM